jgi:hypothetical protein
MPDMSKRGAILKKNAGALFINMPKLITIHYFILNYVVPFCPVFEIA